MGSYSPRYVSASETHTDERSIAMVTPQTCSTKVASLGHSPISCARSDIVPIGSGVVVHALR